MARAVMPGLMIVPSAITTQCPNSYGVSNRWLRGCQEGPLAGEMDGMNDVDSTLTASIPMVGAMSIRS